MKQLKKHPLIVGTALLTLSGLISRTIGFIYRIYLSRLVGAEGMGIYQILNPVLAIAFSLTAAGYQTAISKLVAEKSAGQKSTSYSPLIAGILITLPLSLLCTWALYCFSDYIAATFLGAPSTAGMLRMLAFSIPFSSIHSCINGHFYGLKKAGYPAFAQIMEQITRVASVFLLSQISLSQGRTPSVSCAVLGLVIGEFFSLLVSLVTFWYEYGKSPLTTVERALPLHKLPTKGILGLALPITANRIVLNILGSIENVSIPSQLRLYGYDSSTALSVYGTLTGMAMPFIFFPNALTNSIAVLLLPMVSENKALGNYEELRKTIHKTLRYCLYMGAFFLCFFLLAGNLLGNIVFQNPLAGSFITTLSFICPFMYLDTTLSSILQGLDMTTGLFLINVSALGLRLLFLFLFVPQVGITGYLWGLLAGQIWTCGLYLLSLHRRLKHLGL